MFDFVAENVVTERLQHAIVCNQLRQCIGASSRKTQLNIGFSS